MVFDWYNYPIPNDMKEVHPMATLQQLKNKEIALVLLKTKAILINKTPNVKII